MLLKNENNATNYNENNGKEEPGKRHRNDWEEYGNILGMVWGMK